MYDVIVAGGGPAGLTAAVYAARAGRSVLVLERAVPGGQIVYSPLVENYPGMPGVNGADFSQELAGQAEGFGAEIAYAGFQGFRPAGDGYAVDTEEGEKLCRALVLALGASHRHLGLPDEEALTGRGVSYCAVCDGAFYKGKDTAIVGGGDTALQDALFLSNVCRKVTLIHRREQFRGAESLVRQVRARENIELLLGWTPQGFLQRDGMVSGLALKRAGGDETREITVDGVFIAVGQQPGTDPVKGLLRLDEGGYFPAGEDCRTELSGVFAAGDCRSKAVRQLTTAVADGAVAGLAAAQYAEASKPS